MDAISLIVYGAIILASATVVVIALKKNGAITDLLVGGVTVSVKAAEAILKRFDKDPETMSPTDKIMRYAVIAVSSIEQQYKGIKTKMKNEGKDVTEMNAEMKEAAIRLLESLAAIDEYSLTDQDKAYLGDIVEAALEMFINKK